MIRVFLIFLETCQCPRKLYVSWHPVNPYAFEKNGKVVGIFPEFLNAMLMQICGKCSAYKNIPLYFDRTKGGRNPIRASESELKDKISDDVHIHLTVTGRKELTVFQGQYQFVQILESPGSAFIVVDQTKLSKTRVIFKSLLNTWPVVLISLLMACVAGMFIWVFVSVELLECILTFTLREGILLICCVTDEYRRQ